MRSRSIPSVVNVLAASAVLLWSAQARAADSFAGKYQADKVSIELNAASDGSYTGTIRMSDKQFPLKAHAEAGKLTGSFTSDGTDFAFTATIEGDNLKLVTSGAALTLKRQAPPPPNPLAEGGSALPGESAR